MVKRAPQHLKKPGRDFWKKVLNDFQMTEAHDLERLSMACECLDRMQEARDKVITDGAYFIDRWQQPKEHPAMAVQRNNAKLFTQIIRELCLDITIPEDNRPPTRY